MVWLVRPGENSLDHALDRDLYIWLRANDLVVSRQFHSREPHPDWQTVSLPIQLYLVDAFAYGASAIAAASVRYFKLQVLLL